MFGLVGKTTGSDTSLEKANQNGGQIRTPRTAEEWDEFRVRYDKFQRALDIATAQIKGEGEGNSDKAPSQTKPSPLNQSVNSGNSWAAMLANPQRSEALWRTGR